jgi:transcriptional regulator with XRE-family HTH domain
MIIHTAKKQFGAWLQRQRDSSNIKRSELAFALGYQNVNKGCRRIVQWEQGDYSPTAKQALILQKKLQITKEEWSIENNKVKLAIDLQELYSKTTSNIIANTQKVLSTHAALLLKNVTTINNARNWRHIQLPGQHFYMAYIGGASAVQLGPLLNIWIKGGLRTKINHRELYFSSGSCSPLSGRHILDGFDIVRGNWKRFRNVPRGEATSLIKKAIFQLRKNSLGNSTWSLPQLLSQFGISIKPADIFWQENQIGYYDFHTAELYYKNSKINFPLRINDVHNLQYTNATTEEVWGPKYQKNRLILGNISTAQFGTYLGEKQTVYSQKGTWSLLPGIAVNPAGIPTIRWTNDIPPLVQVWLIEQIGCFKSCPN